MVDQADSVGRLLDRQEICDLIAQYATGVDTQDYERLIACFSPDGRMVSAGGVLEGIEAIRAAMSPDALARARQASSGLQFDKSTHQMSNILVALDGDRATAESSATVFLVGPQDGREVLAVRGVRYLDAFVRLPDGWRICSREHRLDWQFGPVPLAGAR